MRGFLAPYFRTFLKKAAESATALESSSEAGCEKVARFIERACEIQATNKNTSRAWVHPFEVCVLASWVFSNYGEWEALVGEMGERDAVLSGLRTLVAGESENLPPEELVTVERIRTQYQILQEARFTIPKAKKSKAGSFAVCLDNQVVGEFFPTNGEEGEIEVFDNAERSLAKINLPTPLKPVDKHILTSLFYSIKKNCTEFGGKRFFYMTKKAFGRSFYGMSDEGIHEGELAIIENSVKRLANALVCHIRIPIESSRILGGYCYLNKEKRSQEGSLLLPIPFLPLYNGGKCAYVDEGGHLAPAWVIEEQELYNSPLYQMIDRTDRNYALPIRLIPTGIRKTEGLVNACCDIFDKYIFRWFKEKEAPTIIHLTDYVKKDPTVSRAATTKKTQNTLRRLCETLASWDEAGACSFAVGIRQKDGSFTYTESVKDKKGRVVRGEDGKPKKKPHSWGSKEVRKLVLAGKIERVMLLNVDRKNEVWQRIQKDNAETETDQENG